MPTGPTGPSAASEVETFRQLLLGGELDIEAPISEDEVLSALALFSISTVLLAGMSRRRVGNEDKVDVFGVLIRELKLDDRADEIFAFYLGRQNAIRDCMERAYRQALGQGGDRIVAVLFGAGDAAPGCEKRAFQDYPQGAINVPAEAHFSLYVLAKDS